MSKISSGQYLSAVGLDCRAVSTIETVWGQSDSILSLNSFSLPIKQSAFVYKQSKYKNPSSSDPFGWFDWLLLSPGGVILPLVVAVASQELVAAADVGPFVGWAG